MRECESTARCTTENAVLLLTNFSNAWEVRKRSKATTQDRRRRRKRHRVKRPHQHRACGGVEEVAIYPASRGPRSRGGAAFGGA